MCAGLRELAKVSGYKAETLTSLERCSNFKRTYQLLLQIWQAMYRAMVSAFNTDNSNLPELVISEDETPIEMLKTIEYTLNESETQSDFRSYIEKLSTIDHGSRF